MQALEGARSHGSVERRRSESGEEHRRGVHQCRVVQGLAAERAAPKPDGVFFGRLGTGPRLGISPALRCTSNTLLSRRELAVEM